MTKAINQKVLNKSGRSLVRHGYWKTKAWEGVWDNGKRVGKHIYYVNGTIAWIEVFDKLGRVLINIEYNNSWNADPLNAVSNVTAREYESNKDKYASDMGWDRVNDDNVHICMNLELVERVLDANHEILMGCISAH
jgi:hypothetical protein